MKNRTFLVLAVMFLLPLAVSMTGCGGGNGEEGDADADLEVQPDGTDGETDVTPDRPPDPGQEDTAGDPQPDEIAEVTEEDVPGDEGIEATPVEQFCRSVVDGLCGYIADCCTADEQALMELGTSIDCDDPEASSMYTECVADSQSSVDEGRLVVNVAELSACQGALGALATDCPNGGLFQRAFMGALFVGCDAALEGQVAEGNECTQPFDCQDGWCLEPDPLGSCEPFVDEGGTCSANAECGPGNSCIDTACAPLAGNGDTCDPEDNEDCQVGLWCDATNDRCSDMLSSGDECAPGGAPCEGLCNPSVDPQVCVDFCNGV